MDKILFWNLYLLKIKLNVIMQGIKTKGDDFLGQDSSGATLIRSEFTQCGKWSR